MALVGHWSLNGNANDYSGYINHGTPHSDVNWVDGKIGLALSDSYVTIPNAEHLQTIGKTTIAFWIYARSSTNRRTIIDKAYGGEFTINLETNGKLRFYCGLAGKMILLIQVLILVFFLKINGCMPF